MQVPSPKCSIVLGVAFRNVLWVSRILKVVVLIYVINYVAGWLIIGTPRLERVCRPKCAVPFDSERWKSATFHSGLRYPMAQHLLNSKSLEGLTVEQVLNRLGLPSARSQTSSGEILCYELAPQYKYPAESWLYPWLFVNVESWVLHIEVKNGVVVGVDIHGT